MTLVKSSRSRSGCCYILFRKWLSVDKKISFSSSFCGVINVWFSVDDFKARLFARRKKRSDLSLSMLLVFLCMTRDAFRCAFRNVFELLSRAFAKVLSFTVSLDCSYNFLWTSFVKVRRDLFLTRPVIKWE